MPFLFCLRYTTSAGSAWPYLFQSMSMNYTELTIVQLSVQETDLISYLIPHILIHIMDHNRRNQQI